MAASKYQKGARSERELLNILTERGWSVTRSAGSGVNAISPDLIAIKNGKCISIECKAWNKGSLSIDQDQFSKLLDWKENSAFPTLVAWRMNGKGWYFINLDEFTSGRARHNITRKHVMQVNRTLDDVFKDETKTS